MEPSEWRFYNTPGCLSDWLLWITSYLGSFFLVASYSFTLSLLPLPLLSLPFSSHASLSNTSSQFHTASPFFPSFHSLSYNPRTPPQMESLFGSLPEMLDFQRVFLQTLEERIASSPDFSTLETPSQFKVRCTHSNIGNYWLNVQMFSVDSMSVTIQNNIILKPGDFRNYSKERHSLWDLEVYK